MPDNRRKPALLPAGNQPPAVAADLRLPRGPVRAIYRLVGIIHHTTRRNGISRPAAGKAVTPMDRRIYAAGCRPKPDAMSYNDTRGRRPAEVIAALRAAA